MYKDGGLGGLKGGFTWIRASINDYVIENFVGAVGFVGVVILGLYSYQLLNKIAVLVVTALLFPRT